MLIDNPETIEQLAEEINALMTRIIDLANKHIEDHPQYEFRSPKRVYLNRLINARNVTMQLRANLNNEIKK